MPPTLVNPFAAFSISDVWREGHRAIDFRTPQGTRFVSPGDGVYRRRPSELDSTKPGQAGHYGDLVFDDGGYIRFAHLEGHIARDGVKVERGVTVLGVTGNTGTSSGPHVHTFAVDKDGNRYDWTRLASPIPAGGDSSPFPDGDDDVPLTKDEKDEIADLVAAAVWASALGRDEARRTALEMLSEARTAARRSAEILEDQVKDWSANGTITGTGKPGRLFARLNAAAEPASIDLAAFAELLAPRLPGATPPAQIEAAVRAALEDLTLTLKP